LLPSNLLRIRVRGGEVKPIFSSPDLHIEVAKELIEIYGSSLQEKKGVIDDRVSTLEGVYDYRLVRGLSTLLQRRCTFEVKSALEPRKARLTLFELASKERAVTEKERERVVLLASERLRIRPQDLEDALFADLDSQQVLVAFNVISPDSLLRIYNLSVLQTLLFKALRLEFTASGNWKRIFREIKRQGLMYMVESVNGQEDGYRISVEGPLSLFRMTDRYGTSFAKLIPHIISAPQWSLRADILARSRGRVYTFQLSSNEASGVIGHQAEESAKEEEYDSSLEERFARNFEAMNTGWILRREPEPLKAGNHVMIPDFSFEKAGYKVYLEIMGFWTEEYLNRKVAKLKQLSDRYDIIVAADEHLACSKLSKARSDVIYFKKIVPIGPVLAHLKKYDERILEAEVNSFNIEIDSSKPVIKLIDLAREGKVSVETVRRALASKSFQGYDLVGDMLISQEVLSKLEEDLVKCKKLSEAIAVMAGYGIDEPNIVLTKLGFVVRYVSLDPEALEIRKASDAAS
jgi:predicted nuclease of restriction endonuclease-like RecB superfamily